MALLYVAILNFLRRLYHSFKIEMGSLAFLRQRQGLAHERGLQRSVPWQFPTIGIIEIVISCFLLLNSPTTARNLAPRVIIVNLCLRSCHLT